jgi:hypothetical protein
MAQAEGSNVNLFIKRAISKAISDSQGRLNLRAERAMVMTPVQRRVFAGTFWETMRRLGYPGSHTDQDN